ncbi:hypothetical protein H8R18_01350 [Nanchangia anserum]|uniref:hypothetical protein n=1 Tax=Nanchangia anserum TaxID=2692125 RepID=UPI0018842BAA|nr:hypothetical protein [Nanchangia anserum]QOX82051.1 hypothetical protein H8R18_01350 [Nanchangia anserum]
MFSCDIKTGEILAELPTRPSGDVTRALMTTTTASFSLPIADPACPRDWLGYTAPWRVVFVLASDDGRIWWAGIPTARTFNAASEKVEISASSLEAYLGRRYVPARRFDRTDQADIAAWLVSSTLDAGIPIEIDAPATGVLRDREYTTDEAGTVLQRLTDLSGVIDGPEWWIETAWATPGERSRIKHVFHVGYPRIGVAATRPQAVFEIPGGLLDLKLEERWGESEAATLVVVSGEGEGETKPISSDHVALKQEWAGYPRLEVRQQAQNVTEMATLEAKAEKTLARLSTGTRVLSLSQALDASPRLGVDWDMGDDVRIIANTPALTLDEVLRLVGWSVDPEGTKVTPIVASLSEPSEDKGIENR